jgi:hypothetical protein
LFDIFHVETKLKTCADEVDRLTGELQDKEKDVKAMNKAADKQAKVKAEKEKEFAVIDKQVDPSLSFGMPHVDTQIYSTNAFACACSLCWR